MHKNLPVHEDESDLSGRVKELGKIFEGGGPIFPRTAKNDSDAGKPLALVFCRLKTISKVHTIKTEDSC